MRRPLAVALLSLGALASAGAPPVRADEPKAPAKAPTLAADEEVATALAKFKDDWKAKGLKGDDRLSQREFAVRQLARFQHPKVVQEVAAVTRDPDPTIRLIGVIYLGDMTLLPGVAGPRVVAALKAAGNDTVMVLTCLQSIGNLKYLGAREELKGALRDPSFAVKKAAIEAIGRTGDLRLLQEMLKVIGVDLAGDAGTPDSPDGKEVVSEGYSWEGAEASVDTGTAGDADQKAAEAKVKAQIAANQAAAAQAAGGGPGGGAGGTTGPVGRGGGSSRSTQELVYPVVAALKRMTGKAFSGPKDVRAWHRANVADVARKAKDLDEQERAQKSAAK